MAFESHFKVQIKENNLVFITVIKILMITHTPKLIYIKTCYDEV